MNTIGKLMIATAFSATVAGALTGAALSGETPEIKPAETCASVHWPLIPAECLEGAPARNVRDVTGNLANIDRNMQQRFAVAFQ